MTQYAGRKKKVVYVPLAKIPEDMQKRIMRMLNATWGTIAYAIFQCMRECEDKRQSIPASEVIEVTTDVDYPRMHGGDKEAADAFYSLSYDDRDVIAKKAFPLKKYGL